MPLSCTETAHSASNGLDVSLTHNCQWECLELHYNLHGADRLGEAVLSRGALMWVTKACNCWFDKLPRTKRYTDIVYEIYFP